MWEDRHRETLDTLGSEQMPSGAGIDAGTSLNLDESKPDRLVFNTSYHHMNDVGYYDGWTEHKVIVKPSLAFGITVDITGSNRNDIKDYLVDVFRGALTTQVEH